MADTKGKQESEEEKKAGGSGSGSEGDGNAADNRTPEAVKKRQEEWEEEEIHEKSAASAETVYKAILLEANEELIRPSSALAWSGLAAGLSMGFSLITEGLMASHLPDT